jgi:hypothetical protein
LHGNRHKTTAVGFVPSPIPSYFPASTITTLCHRNTTWNTDLQSANKNNTRSCRQKKDVLVSESSCQGKGKEEAVKDQTAAEGCHCPRGFDEEDRSNRQQDWKQLRRP